MELKLRKDVPNNKAYYNLTLTDEIEYSVVDFSEVMRTAPKILKDSVFQGWEAIRIVKGILDTKQMERSSSKKELLSLLETKHKHEMNIIKSLLTATKLTEPLQVNEAGTYYEINPVRVGSIKHKFLVKDGRATRVEAFDKANHSLPLNSCAELHEVETLISVLVELREIMKKSKTNPTPTN